jgi:predicted dehydrogenase
MSDRKCINRRQFVRRTAGAAMGGISFPFIIPSSVLGKSNGVAPSDKITVGCVGVGNRGRGELSSFIREPDTQVVAVCDVDANHLRGAKEDVDRRYGNGDCAAYNDFRDLIARNDIDAVQIATPDHWHALVAIAAAKAGKDMYGEKPFSHSLREGRAACDAIKRYGRVWQTGSQLRSDAHIQFARELVLNGRIGKVHTVEVGMPGGLGLKRASMVEVGDFSSCDRF